MRKKINDVLYDAATSALIAEVDSITVFSGRIYTVKKLAPLYFIVNFIRWIHGQNEPFI